MTIVGTRPELIKLSRVIPALDAAVEHVLVHTGQNHAYELSEVFFRDLGLRRPDHFLEVAGGTAMEAIGRVLARTDEVLERERPDAVLYYGDTNSCLGVMACKRRRIPVFHMEAGNRCFDFRVPEEANRRVVDHLADVNLVVSEHARRNLLAEGLPADRVIKTGSSMREVLSVHREAIEASEVLGELGLEAGEYFLVSAHREENVDEPGRLARLRGTLAALHEEYGVPVVVSTHPRTRARLEAAGAVPGAGEAASAAGEPASGGSSGAPASSPPGVLYRSVQSPEGSGVRWLPAFGFHDYVHLQQRARCVLSDSGTITEEAALLGFPAVTIRESHERPEGMDAGVLVMCGIDPPRVLEAVRVVLAQHGVAGRPAPEVEDYRPANVAEQVVRIVLSYTAYVRRVVWGEGAEG